MLVKVKQMVLCCVSKSSEIVDKVSGKVATVSNCEANTDVKSVCKRYRGHIQPRPPCTLTHACSPSSVTRKADQQLNGALLQTATR